MRHVWFAAFAAGLCFGTSATAAGPAKISNDCDQLEFRMQMSQKEGQRASCVASATSAGGQRITKTFTAYVKTLPSVGKQGPTTEAMIIDESCESCGEPVHHKFGLGEFGKISALATASVAAEADGLDEDAEVQAELREGIESCMTNQLGQPLNLKPVQLLQCRINTLNTREGEDEIAYYRRWLQPELQRLVRSFDANQRLLGRRALQLIDQSHQAEPRLHEALKDMGHFITYREMVDAASQAIEAAGPNPQARASEVARLGMLQRQWTRTYQQRRDALEAQGALDDNLRQNSKLMEASLNAMYAKYGDEIKQAQRAQPAPDTGASSGQGQGRTLFGQPLKAPTATPATGRAATPPVGASAAQKFNSQVLRPQ